MAVTAVKGLRSHNMDYDHHNSILAYLMMAASSYDNLIHELLKSLIIII